jgi:muramoyltetrapeptide carboxypeptidase
MELIKPKRLKKGDRIRIVAPASSMVSLSKQAVKTGIDNLEKLGFEVEVHPDVYRTYKGTAGKPNERAKSLMEAFADESVDGIMCCWGGFNSNDIIDHLDYEVFRENPKVFTGYSDITILNAVLYQKAGLINFHGLAFITFTHDFLMDWEVEVFKQLVMNGTAPYSIKAAPTFIDDPLFWKHPETPVEEVENPGWIMVREGEAFGRLIAGHFGTLLCLAGTKYWPNLNGHILMLECDEEDVGPNNISRQLRHLKQVGALDEVSGLVIGRIPSMLGLKGDQSIESLLVDVVDRDIPVVIQFDFGHTNPFATIPVGVQAELSTEKKALTILESSVR